MKPAKIFSDNNCMKLAKKIKEDIYKPAYNFKTTIFLCGAKLSDKAKLRYNIAKALKEDFHSWFYYDIIFPEDIFDQLLYSSKAGDLLSLERLLADSVDAILLVPESPGSFAELGAFANDTILRAKLICVLDKKYKKDRSFINQGPIKLVKNEKRNGIIYVDPNKLGEEVGNLIASLRKIKKSSIKNSDNISLLQLKNFIIPAIFLLQPIDVLTLVKIVSNVVSDYTNTSHITNAALSVLTKKNLCALTTNGYVLTEKGVETFKAFQKRKTRIKHNEEIIEFDNLQLEIFNFKYRRKKLMI